MQLLPVPRYNREEVVASLGREINLNPPLTLGQLPDTSEELLKLDQVNPSGPSFPEAKNPKRKDGMLGRHLMDIDVGHGSSIYIGHQGGIPVKCWPGIKSFLTLSFSPQL